MIDWDDSPEDADFRARLRRWLSDELDSEWASIVPSLPLAQQLAEFRDWQGRLAAAGWAGISWPREFGGYGGTPIQQVILLEELARAGVPRDMFRIGVGLVGPTLIELGTDAQRRRYLPPMLTGQELWCQGFSEPEAGSDLASLRTRAESEGSAFRITGHKVWTTYGKDADYCLVLARTDQDAVPHRGISAFIVDLSQDGVEARLIRQINGESDFSELYLDGVRVGPEDIIGSLGGGWHAAMVMLGFERRMIANFAFACVTLLRQMRPLFGDEPSPAFGELVLRARLAVLNAYRFAQMPAMPGPESSLQKLQATELLHEIHELRFRETLARVGRPSHQDGGDLEAAGRGLLSAYGMTLAGGTSEIQRNILAQRALGLPREPQFTEMEWTSRPHTSIFFSERLSEIS